MPRTIKMPGDKGYVIDCPGCKSMHIFDKRWTFNGSLDLPTFNPSMNASWGPMPEGHKNAGQVERCHSFVRDGKIQFLGDCTHAFANQTVDLLEIPPERARYYDGSMDGLGEP